MHKPTKEQQEIIQANTKKIKIQALSGYGKTHTLIEKCIWHLKNSNTNLKIIYIVFNESMKKNTQQKIQKYFKKSFGTYTTKSMLECVEIKTTDELAINILRKKLGAFALEKFDNTDIKNFLYTNQDIKYTNQDIEEIHTKLKTYYNSTRTITEILKEQIQDAFGEEEEQHIASIYSGVIAIIDAQMKLSFYINQDACLKLASSIDISDLYYDMALIDEAQDVNIFVYKIFISLKSNIKIIAGDSLASIFSKQKSIDILSINDDFEIYKLSSSLRLPKLACDYVNKVLYKLSKKSKMIGSSADFQTDINEISKHNTIHIHKNNITMLEDVYKSALNNKKIYIVNGFINEYKEFLAMCYIVSDFDKFFLRFSLDIKSISEKFMQKESLKNYIEITKNQSHKNYFALIQKWQKTLPSIKDRVHSIKQHYVSKESLSDIKYSLVQHTKAIEFEYGIISDDFINQTRVHTIDDNVKQELKLLYIATTRCKLGVCRMV